MSLIDHIRELRNRLLKAVLGIGLGMIFGFIFFNPVWRFIQRPYCKIPQQNRLLNTHGCTLVVNGLFDGFFIHLKIIFVVGLIVSSPIWFYQLWAFIAPGLYAREALDLGLRWTAVPLFVLGGGFAYLAMTRGLHFLLGLVPSTRWP